MTATDRIADERHCDGIAAASAAMLAEPEASAPSSEREAPVRLLTLQSPITVRIAGSQELGSLEPAWRDLFHGCRDANPFYGPDFLLPLLGLDRKLARAHFVIAERRCGPGIELAAFCPITPTGLGLPGVRRSVGTAQHPFIFNHLPLLRAGAELSLWQRMLDALELEFGRGMLAISASPLDSPVAQGLRHALAASGRASLTMARGERAAIIAQGSAEAHLARIKARALAKIRRHERELRKLGQVDFVSVEFRRGAGQGGGRVHRAGRARLEGPARLGTSLRRARARLRASGAVIGKRCARRARRLPDA